MELVIDCISKYYKNKVAVDHISLVLKEGVYGLLGANGAGKTTLMRIICGVLEPTSGTVTYNKTNVNTEEFRSELGYLPQDFGYYPEFTGRDFVLYMAALKGLGKKEADKKCRELLQLVSLEDMAKRKIKTYSGGMKQRLGIAQALLNDPKILILDEPTAGLDPKERVHFRNLIAQIAKNSIVILSTHIVSDVDKIANHILMMNEGQLVFSGKRDEIQEDLEDFYLRTFGGEIE